LNNLNNFVQAAAKPASSGSKAHQVDNIAGDGTNGNKGTLDDILALLNGVGNRKIVAIRYATTFC
jgi:hypothetical protein